jgi:hypothetical protein
MDMSRFKKFRIDVNTISGSECCKTLKKSREDYSLKLTSSE